MLFTLYLLALSTLSTLVASAPYVPQSGELQRHRRRAVDYPVSPLKDGGPLRKRQLNKRSLPYSVVPVDGGSAATAQSPTEIVTKTIVTTEPAITFTPAPSVKTLTYTSIVTENMPEETMVFTTTLVLQPPPKTISAVSTISGTATEANVIVQTEQVTHVVTATPSPTSTHYYDDGMWHTFYPVKSWAVSTTPTPTSSTIAAPAANEIDARARGTGWVQGAALPTAWHGNTYHARNNRRSAPAVTPSPDWDLTRTEYEGLRKFME